VDELRTEVYAWSHSKAIPGSRVKASEFPSSEPLDQEVKTKLILELVTEYVWSTSLDQYK